MVLPSPRRARNASIVLAMIMLSHFAPTARAQVFDYPIEDPGSHGGLGSAVCRLGDIDFDGAEDFAVSAPFATGSGVAGTGIVFFESGATGSNISTLAGTPGCNLGASIDGHIDVDGDGYLDVLIGAPLDSSSGVSESGAIYVFSPHLGTIPIYWYGFTPKGHFGSSIRNLAADIDGDGLDDFIAGEPGNDSSYAFYAKGSLYFANSGQSGSHFGTSVCRGGDLDGDGTCDYFAGSPDYVDSSSTTTGRIDAFSGKDGSKLWSADGAADSKFGKSLAQPGDLDGDGIADIVVGAPQHPDSGGNQTGCATVLSGATQKVIYRAFGDNNNDTFGHELHAVGGDIDQDGTNDFIVGAPQQLGSDVGYARTISGATGNTLFTYTEHTSDPYSMSAYGVAVCGGDFNNDGRTDVLIGGNNFVAGDGIAETWITAIARWNNYGKGWAGTSGVPAFIPLSDPVVGQSLNLDLNNSLGASTAGILVLGFSKDSIPTGKGGTLLVDPFLFVPLSIPAGGLTLSGNVPDDPSLYGFDVYLQAIEADSGASKGLSFTRGLDLFFGF